MTLLEKCYAPQADYTLGVASHQHGCVFQESEGLDGGVVPRHLPTGATGLQEEGRMQRIQTSVLISFRVRIADNVNVS